MLRKMLGKIWLVVRELCYFTCCKIMKIILYCRHLLLLFISLTQNKECCELTFIRMYYCNIELVVFLWSDRYIWVLVACANAPQLDALIETSKNEGHFCCCLKLFTAHTSEFNSPTYIQLNLSRPWGDSNVITQFPFLAPVRF